ncbi:ribokinase [Deinobacterium chartae]|uniref:Ribokinase n=1 Tax=Deinobacterium chartae TaxID=521158 RepID=A0A841I5Z9_9DEIO|nr:ribokinase [Deinobacterium chartae]MBB6099888.1 ribokinase [Deinobacterium chartae]
MILVAGSANIDFVVRVPHIVTPGETLLGSDYALFAGGKGANQAVAAARCGAPTAFLGAVGADPFAAQLRASLEQAGVDLSRLRTVPRPTGAAFISVSDAGENAITVAPGANAAVTAEGVDLEGVSWLLLQLEIPLETVVALAAQARRRGVRVMLNAAPARDLPEHLLSDLEVLLVNAGELRQLAGGDDAPLEDLAARLQARGPRALVVTLGGEGVYARVDQQNLYIGAFAVGVLDTTGAGDTFAGALASRLAAGEDWAPALRFAAAAAALACTRAGAQASMPTLEETQAFLRARAD